jgi:hypothetical protein
MNCHFLNRILIKKSRINENNFNEYRKANYVHLEWKRGNNGHFLKTNRQAYLLNQKRCDR